MRKIWLVVKREYLARVRTKGFIIGTVAFPLFMVGIVALPVILMRHQTDRGLKLAILDNTGEMAADVVQSLDRKLPNGDPAYDVVKIFEEPRPEEEEALREELRAQVNQTELDGFLIIPMDVLEGESAAFHTRNTGDLELARSIRSAVREAAIAERLRDRGLEIGNVRDLVQGVGVTLVKVTKEGEVEEKGQTLATALVMMVVLYVTLLVYGLATLRSVLEEKTTRMSEILVSSLRAFHLLVGKLLGVAAAGFTQYLIWTITAALLAAYGTVLASAVRPGSAIPNIQLPISTLVYLVVFYLGGYFLYASLYAAAGAMVSTDEDAQQVQTPLTLLVLLAYLMFIVVMRNPSSTLSIVLSLIPFFAPILMVLRIVLQTPPFWQIALSIALIVLTTTGIVFVSAKIYRVGILMYGKRPSVVELWRWLRYT
ncbi:MAG: ABC transporter permease [Acidobacteria bacterium]|nr:ABC transporter permease [Acidobacteriota bacterium]